jgi:hypothetical protein
VIEHLGRLAVVPDPFQQGGPDRLEKANFIADAQRRFVRHRQSKPAGKIVHGLQKSLFGILRENKFLPRWDHRKPLLCRPLRQGVEIEAVE